MVRDPRSIFASMEKNFRKNQHKDSGLVDHSKMTGTTTEKRIDQWVASPPVGIAMERLYQIIKEGIDQKILFVKFEDFTKNPAKEMERIYDYLNIPYFEHDFDNVEQITKEDDEVYGIYGDHKIQKKIQPVVPDYNQILGKQAADWIKNNYKWFYDYFQYK
jgi:sulfotransferase